MMRKLVRIAAVAASGGTVLPVVVMALGTAMIMFGASDTIEGIGDIQAAISRQGLDQMSYNPVRESVFGGNETAYTLTEMGVSFVFDVITGMAIAKMPTRLKPPAQAFRATSAAGKVESSNNSGSVSRWWHKGYVDNLSDIQMILGVNQSEKGLSTLGSATRENAISAGKAWVGENYNLIRDNAGNVLGYSSADGMRAFRIQYKPKECMWRANFQENIMVNNPYPNPGQHSSQLKNVHIDILE